MIQFNIPPGKAAVIILFLLSSIESSYQFQRYESDARRVRLYRNVANNNIQEIPTNDKGRATEQLYDRRSFRTGTDSLADNLNTRSSETDKSNRFREQRYPAREEYNLNIRYTSELSRERAKTRNIVKKDSSRTERLERSTSAILNRERVEVDLTWKDPNLFHRMSSRTVRTEREIREQPTRDTVDFDVYRRDQNRYRLNNIPEARENHENRDRRSVSSGSCGIHRNYRSTSTHMSRRKVEAVRQYFIRRVDNTSGSRRNRMQNIGIRDSFIHERRQRFKTAQISRENGNNENIFRENRLRDSRSSEENQLNIRDARNNQENPIFLSQRIGDSGAGNHRRFNNAAVTRSIININIDRIIKRESDQNRESRKILNKPVFSNTHNGPNEIIREERLLSRVDIAFQTSSRNLPGTSTSLFETETHRSNSAGRSRNGIAVQFIKENRSIERKPMATRNYIDQSINKNPSRRENIDFSEYNDRRQGSRGQNIRYTSNIRKITYTWDHVRTKNQPEQEGQHIITSDNLNRKATIQGISEDQAKTNTERSYIEKLPGDQCSSFLEESTTKKVLRDTENVDQHGVSRIREDLRLMTLKTLQNNSRMSRYAIPGSDSTRRLMHNSRITLSNYDMERHAQHTKSYRMTNSSSSTFMHSIENDSNLRGRTIGITLTNTRSFNDASIPLDNDSNLWINTLQIILGAYLLGQMFVNSSKKNKIRYSAMVPFTSGMVKGKVQ